MQELEIRSGVINPIDCAKEGFELIKSDYWLLLAIWLVGGMIGGVTMLIAAGAMTCGTFYCYLRKIDGHPVKFEDLWKGMQHFLPGLIVMLLIAIPMIAVYVLIYVPIVMSAVMGSKLSQDELLALLVGAALIDLLVIVVMICVHTLLIFAFPLIVDRGLGAFAAMKLSARAVLKNMGGVLGLLMVNFALVLVGELALCIGIYFVIPIIIAANVVAYRKIFPNMATPVNFPPPPPVFQGGS